MRFGTENGRARFSVIQVEAPGPESAGLLRLSTRRRETVQQYDLWATDPLNGARRDDVLMSEVDAARLGVTDGDKIEQVFRLQIPMDNAFLVGRGQAVRNLQGILGSLSCRQRSLPEALAEGLPG